MDAIARDGDRYVEEPVIDGSPAAVGLVAESSAGALALVQNGFFRTYALVFVGGAVIGGVVLLIVRVYA